MQADLQQTRLRSPKHAAMRRILSELQNHPLAWAFQQPVNPDEVADYHTVIKNPMGTSRAHIINKTHPRTSSRTDMLAFLFCDRLQHDGTQN